MSSFTTPAFYNYPPYFTLQPVKETRDRQTSLWCGLILSYCKHNKVYVVSLGEEFPLFANESIERKLNTEAKAAFLSELVAKGDAEWLDKSKQACLVLWRKIPEWADYIHQWVRTCGLQDAVMTLDDLTRGDDVRGTDLFGLHIQVLMRALKVMESKGQATVFTGATPEEQGVKFL